VKPTGARVWQTALGIGISAVFLYFALRGENLAALGREILRARPGWFVLSVALATATFPLRALRLRLMLARSAGAAALYPVWQATAIGFMANNVLPARGGEVVRAYAAARLVPTKFTTVLGALAVERVFDGLVMVLLLAVAVVDPGFRATASIGGRNVSAMAQWAGLVFIALLAVLFAMVHAPGGVLAFAARALRRVLPPRAAEFVVGLARSFIEGLSILRAPGDFAHVLGWSFAVWLVNGLAFYVGFLAFGIAGLPFSSALLLQGVVAIGVAIPSSPGFFGLFEYASRAGLGLYGVATTSAVSFAIGIHIGWFIPITAIGLWTLARANLSLADLRTGREEAA
jgi:hypothetical protein